MGVRKRPGQMSLPEPIPERPEADCDTGCPERDRHDCQHKQDEEPYWNIGRKQRELVGWGKMVM